MVTVNGPIHDYEVDSISLKNVKEFALKRPRAITICADSPMSLEGCALTLIPFEIVLIHSS